MGFTTRPLTTKGIDTYTVEVNPGYGWMAARDLKDIPNLTLIHGDSGTAIEKLGSDGQLTRPFVYLDAHWGERLPLNDEVKSLCAHCQDFVVVVDDFRVPHMPDYGYDTYNGVSLSLESIDLDDDVIVAYPATPPERETGSKRGAVYLGRGDSARAALAAAGEAELVSIQTRPL